jgi:hypothetical protein
VQQTRRLPTVDTVIISQAHDLLYGVTTLGATEGEPSSQGKDWDLVVFVVVRGDQRRQRVDGARVVAVYHEVELDLLGDR